QPLAHRQLALFAVTIQRLASDELHHEIRQAFVRGAAIDQARDVGMIEIGEDLSLGTQTLQDEVAVITRWHELDRHFLVVLSIDTARAIHLAHAAVTDERNDLVRADPLTDPAVAAREHFTATHVRSGGPIDDSIGLIVRIEQRHDLGAQRRVTCASFVEVTIALGRVELARRGENIFHALPAIRSHAPSPVVISRCSHARAIAHSRFTVAGETPMTSAVSLMLRPPKKRSSTNLPCCGSSASSRLSASSIAAKSIAGS